MIASQFVLAGKLVLQVTVTLATALMLHVHESANEEQLEMVKREHQNRVLMCPTRKG